MSRSNIRSTVLGWFSLGLGTTQVVAPHAVARLIGIRDGGPSRRLMRVLGARELAAGIGLLAQPGAGRWLWARVAGDMMDLTLLGAALVLPGTRRERVAVAISAVGAVTLADLAAAEALEDGTHETQRLRKAITINRSPQDVYWFWRDFAQFPLFMSHVERVEVTSNTRSHWSVRGPFGRSVEWDAEIVEERPNSRIAWRSIGGPVEHSGRVHIVGAPGGRGTEVAVEMHYRLPARSLAALFARLAGQEPRQQVQADLRKAKQVLETGEVARSEATLEGTHLFQAPAQARAVAATRERGQP